MPCTITGSLLGDAQLHLAEARKIAHTRNAWLCEVMVVIEQTDSIRYAAFLKDKLSPELVAWWEDHKKQDEEQRQREDKEMSTHKGVQMEEVP